MTVPTTTSPAAKVRALAVTEVKLVLRNRTVAVSSIVLPLLLGVFWAYSFGGDGDPRMQAMVVALQLAVVLGMGIYVTATQTVVARRHARVLKRMRTSGLTDAGLLMATVAPSVALGLVQLAIFAAIDIATGAPTPGDLVPLVLAALGGIALAVTAALATSVITPSPERSQITTLPLTFVLLGSAIAAAVTLLDGWWLAVVLLPGAAIGQLAQLAFSGDAWVSGFLGLPAILPAAATLVMWPVVFAILAKRHFRWDPRN